MTTDATAVLPPQPDGIPILNISARTSNTVADRKILGDQLAHILHHVAFVIITNHGISSDLIQKVFAQSSHFCELPLEEKQRLHKGQSRHFRGWEPVGAESTNGRSDWREQIDLWTEHKQAPSHSPSQEQGDTNENQRKEPIYHSLLGPNQWPTEEMAPGFRPILTEWYNSMQELGDSLMGLFALGLGLEEERFADLFGASEERMSLVKLIRYPATPAGSFGVHAHHDTGFLTILAAGVTPGLQVQKISTSQKNDGEIAAPDTRGGEWMDVPIIPDSFVVNVGEALQHMTGNYFVATPHRVRATSARLSCGYFHGPSLDTPLAMLNDLPRPIHEAVQASPYHSKAGFMTQEGTGNDDGQYEAYNPERSPETWGAQIWNYLSRSYPEIMSKHY